MRSSLPKTFFLVIAILALPALAAEPLDLRLNLDRGKSYSCLMEINQDMMQTVNGQERKLRQEMLMTWRYDVIGTSGNGDIDLTSAYTRVRIRQDYGFQSSEYDSDSPPDYIEPFMRGYAALIGSPLSISVGPKGHILGIDGADSLFDKIIAELDLPESPMRDEIIDGMKGQFGETAIRQALEQIFGFFPESTVVPGQRWTSEKKITTGIPMLVAEQYRLDSREEGIAYISVTSDVSSDPDGRPVKMGPANMLYRIQGTHTGYLKVDERTGLPLESELNMKLSGTVEASGVPDQEPQTWPIRAAGTVRVSFQEISD